MYIMEHANGRHIVKVHFSVASTFCTFAPFDKSTKFNTARKFLLQGGGGLRPLKVRKLVRTKQFQVKSMNICEFTVADIVTNNKWI